MISLEILVAYVDGLQLQDIEHWIDNAWVRPMGTHGHYRFGAIDVARVRLIHELRNDLQINDEALPVVLLLLDQLYDGRRRMLELGHALSQLASVELRQSLAQYLVR